MNEEDTYKKLKGLTYDEAFAICRQISNSYYRNIPYANWNEIEAAINKGLAPYGWTYRRLKAERPNLDESLKALYARRYGNYL